MLLMIDNYDSFTYNLVQYFFELGQEVVVRRNDEISIEQIADLSPEYLVISPGPCTPNEAGISLEAVRHFKEKIPILGICLGHQCIGQAFGSKIIRAKELMHGKLSQVHNDGSGIFEGIPNTFLATRYHSLVIDPNTLSDDLRINGFTEDKTIMAIQHSSFPIIGLQFHPESIASENGIKLLDNFLKIK